MFVHVGPWCQLDAFYFHLFLEGDCFVNSFLLSHSLRKIRLKTVWRDLQIPPNWREKPLFYLFQKSSKPITTNQTTQTGYQPYVPEYSLAPIKSSREISALGLRSKISFNLYFRSEFNAGSRS